MIEVPSRSLLVCVIQEVRWGSSTACFPGPHRPELLYRDGAIWWLEEPDLIDSAEAEKDRRYQADAGNACSIVGLSSNGV